VEVRIFKGEKQKVVAKNITRGHLKGGAHPLNPRMTCIW